MHGEIQITEGIEKVLRSMPASVLGQKIHKAKVLFLGIDKADNGYSKQKQFSANYSNYLVVDGEISYLPEEALNALSSACTVKWTAKTKQAERDGVNHMAGEEYGKQSIPRYDVTIIDTYRLIVEDGKRKLISENSEVSAKATEETMTAVLADREKQLREDIEEEMRIKFETKIKELEAKLEPAISESVIDDLVANVEVD